MPFHIIHQDITRMDCDAIVNPTDKWLSGSGGTDYAVHEAAGEELDEACKKIADQSHPVGSDPVHVSDEALKYRELAARSDAYTVCYQFFATGKAIVPYRSKMSDTPIDEMCLSVRSSNGLMRAGANTFGKVKEIMERENGLRTIRNLGVKSEKEIKLCFFNSCYLLLNEYEKAEWWQEVHSAAHSGRWCGGPAAAVRFKQRPKLVSYIRFNHHGVVLCCPL